MVDGSQASVGGTAASEEPATAGSGRRWPARMVHYPSPGRRRVLIGLVVAATIALYYQQYVGGSVSQSLLAELHMSFRTYLTIIVVSNATGAMASLVAGVADRVGRVALTVVGLFVASVVTLVGIPLAHGSVEFGVLVSIVGAIEGLVLVSTPALIRDFSPQARRGSAMGLWTLGPVLASLVVAEVASQTLPHLPAWQDQYRIAGIIGLVVAAAAAVGLRELAPQLRDQVLVSQRERVLAEARARGIDVAAATRRPWRQMAHPSIVLPALGVSVLLLLYYTAVAFFVLYFVTVHGFSQPRANSLDNWFWAADAVAVVVIGVLSDRVGVRKPFMVLGALGAIAATTVFALVGNEPTTTYDALVVMLVAMSACRGMAYAPWMTAFTETLEDRNPALVATGLAIWGWILRAVVVVAFLVLPVVETNVTPVAQYGPRLVAIEARYGPEVQTLEALAPATRNGLRSTPPAPAAVVQALAEIGQHFGISRAAAVDRLLAVRRVPSADRSYLAAHGPAVQAARKRAPGQWRWWWWACVAGEVAFLPTIGLLRGRWRPAAARRDAEEHRRRVEEVLARLRAEGMVDDVRSGGPRPADAVVGDPQPIVP